MRGTSHPWLNLSKDEMVRQREDSLAVLGMRLFLHATPLLYAGRRVNNWTLLSYHQAGRQRHPHWLCRCECGTERMMRVESLTSGKSKSCGECS